MVIWSTPATKDLKDIFDFIARDSRYYAKKVTKDILHKSMQLEVFPKRGRVVPEIHNPNIREIFISSYRLMYEIGTEHIYILSIVHGKRNFKPDEI